MRQRAQDLAGRAPYRFWSDDFDMDLLRAVPDTSAVVGAAADTPLWTYGGSSYGRLNHPSVWNSARGAVAYFGLDERGGWKPAGCHTASPLVACTWLEVLRDAWPHTYLVVVDGVPVWDAAPLWPVFDELMHDVRGWRPLPPGRAEELKGLVCDSLRTASERLIEVGRHYR